MIRSVASCAAMVVLILGAGASPARAADELGLSWDGTTWAGSLIEPMFDPALLWVPGDTESKAFYVRNEAGSGANLTVAVVTRDADDLLRFKDVRLSARVGANDWVDLQRTEENFRLNTNALPAGESRKVDVRARFDSASPNRSQRKRLSLNFRVTLTDAAVAPDDSPEVPGDVDDESPGPGGPGDEDDESTGPADPGDVDDESGGTPDPNSAADLPNAGAPEVGWLIVAAGATIGAGMALMKRRRREETGHGTAH